MYVVINQNTGETIATGLTLRDAANEILSYDSQEWQIRPMENGGFSLWLRKELANKPWHETTICSFEREESEAENDIFRQVLDRDWLTGPQALTESEYERHLAWLNEND